MLDLTLPPLGAAVCVTPAGLDLTPPAAPAGLHVTGEGDGRVSLAWSAVAGAAGYDVYRSPLSGGGWVQANGAAVTGTTFTDTGLAERADRVLRRPRARRGRQRERPSNEVAALPHLHDRLGEPAVAADHDARASARSTGRTTSTARSGSTARRTSPARRPASRAQLGFGPDGSDPAGNGAWTWVDAAFNTDAGNNDEFVASLLPEATGTFDYAYRYTTTNGRDWVYADLDGIGNGYSPAQAGEPDGDRERRHDAARGAGRPARGLRLARRHRARPGTPWPATRRCTATRCGAATRPAARTRRSRSSPRRATPTTTVAEGQTYFYVVRAVDTSFNRSGDSDEVHGDGRAADGAR